MSFTFDAKPSDSAFVETIWSAQSQQSGDFTSVSAAHWEMVITKFQGKTSITMRGPETKASTAQCSADAEFFGIVFKLGTFMPHLPIQTLLDRNDMYLPEANSKSFWLNGSVWELPTYENADTFVNRLMRQGLLVKDGLISSVLLGHTSDLSVRTVRRRFLQATGLTQKVVQQIERARYAMALLENGASILDTVYRAGYFDQSHLTRSLKHFAGKTPAQINGFNDSSPVSLLYNTYSDAQDTLQMF